MTYPVKIRIHNTSRVPVESVRLGKGSAAIDFPAIAPNNKSDTQGVEQVRLGDPVQVSIKGQSYQAALTAMESSEPLAPGVYTSMISFQDGHLRTALFRDGKWPIDPALVDRNWHWQTVTFPDGTTRIPWAEPPTGKPHQVRDLRFSTQPSKNGDKAGYILEAPVACNTLGGDYLVDGYGSLTTLMTWVTLKYCMEDDLAGSGDVLLGMNETGDLLQVALQPGAISLYRVDGNTLELTSPDGAVLHFYSEPRP